MVKKGRARPGQAQKVLRPESAPELAPPPLP